MTTGNLVKLLCFITITCMTALSNGARAGASMVLTFDRFDAAGPNGGDWYKDSNNDTGTLAWGESYVLMAYAQMYETTGERIYLDKLARHADGVLAQRDDARGVPDYTGSTHPCWQAASYSTQPMCWAVHSGMLTFPMAMLAVYIATAPGLDTLTTYDGTTYAEKAAAILGAVEETYAFHEGEWRDEGASQGYYIFPADASFYDYAGQEMPLNQMNAMGNSAAALWMATGDGSYLDRATRLANHLEANLQVGSGDDYLWNYWGGSYSSPGEDISHAAINVGFAALCAEAGIVFDGTDMMRFGRTFYQNVVIDHKNSHDYVGGGSINGESYRPQMGRWAILGRWDPRVVAAVRNVYETYTSVSSGSVLLGFAYLARHEYFIRPFTFYVADWSDLGDRRQATAYGANVSTMPHGAAVPVLFRMTFEAARSLEVQEWDGSAYHGVLNLAATSGAETVVVPFDPRWYFLYTADGELFQFADAFVAGEGIVVHEPGTCDPPVIDSPPPAAAITEGETFAYSPSTSGQEPMLWFLDGPSGSVVDRTTGAVQWVADSRSGDASFTLRVENDCGDASMSWTLAVTAADEDAQETATEAAEAVDEEEGAADPAAESPDSAGDASVTDIGMDGAGDPVTDAEVPPVDGEGCGCGMAG